MQTGLRDTGQFFYTQAQIHTLKPTPPVHSHYCISILAQGKYSSNPPGRLMAHTLTHDNALIFSFFLPFLRVLSGARTKRCGEIH